MPAAALPNLLVIGAMKCGTSSMHHYLGLHPQVGMSARKELNFFLPERPTMLPGGEGELPLLGEPSTHSRGLDWYRNQFPAAELRGESSVAYSLPWFPDVAEIVAATLPGVRLIYLVRDPLARMLSHYAQFAARERRPLREAFSAPGNPYLAASRYATALEPFLDHFARDHILIVNADSLRSHRRETMRAVFGYLGVDPDFYPAEYDDEHNRTASKGAVYRRLERLRAGRLAGLADRLPRSLRAWSERRLRRSPAAATTGPPPVDPDVARRVLSSLEPEIVRLERMTGWSLPEWRRAIA